MSTIVLVSGAWHGRWCWEELFPLLREKGHDVIAPELLGMGGDATPLSEVSLARWADQIAEIVKAQNGPVALLGHSRGGVVISEVAQRVPESIGLLIYLSAFLLRDGETLGGTIAQATGGSKPSFLVPGPDGTTTTVVKEAVGKVFYNVTPPELVRRAEAAMGPEPMVVFGTPLRLSEDRFGQVPRTYIECLHDNAVPIALQRAMQAHLPCRPVRTLDTDHCAFFSSPTTLAEAIDSLARADLRSPAHNDRSAEKNA